MKNKIIILTFLSLSFFNSNCNNKKLTIEEQYKLPWKEPIGEKMINISRILSNHNVKMCSEYYYRENINSNNEFLVGCSSDGKEWNYYLIWTLSEDLMGPYIDTTITKPYQHRDK
jgi:hypothetical protein